MPSVRKGMSKIKKTQAKHATIRRNRLLKKGKGGRIRR
jgi:hypothetical protein